MNFSRRSPSRGCRIAPSITSPLRRPYRRTWDSETYTSFAAGQVAGGPDEAVVVEHVQDAGDRDQHVVFADHRLGLGPAPAALAAPVAGVAVAEPVPAAAVAAVPVVVAPAALVPAAALVAAVLLLTAALITMP